MLLPPPLTGAPFVACDANARNVAGAWASNLACDRAALLDSSRTAENIRIGSEKELQRKWWSCGAMRNVRHKMLTRLRKKLRFGQ